MSKEDFEQIVIIDDQANLPQESHQKPAKDTQAIFVFDEDQKEASEDSKNNAEQKDQQKDEPMTKTEYKKRLSQLSDAIMQNMSNFTNIKKPEKNYFKEAKEKRKSVQYQTRKSLRLMQQIVIEPKTTAIKVNFQEGTSQSIKSIFSQKQSVQHYQFSMADTIVEPKSLMQIQKVKQNKIDLSGVNSRRRSQLKIEQDKNKNLLKVSNFRDFLYSQLRPNYNIFIEIKKTDSGFFNSIYKFYFQETKKFILSCQKQGFSKYVFSTSEIHMSEDHISYLAKMQASFFGGQFLFYDSGEDCSKTKMMENYKKQLSHITYTQEEGQLRKIEALITTCDNNSTDFTIVDKETNVLQKRWLAGNAKNIQKFTSKVPSFDSNDNCFKMDFKGLSGIPSTKNFILENEDFPDALIFGRKAKDEYVMLIRSPFSIVQAAAIAMSSIHHKFI